MRHLSRTHALAPLTLLSLMLAACGDDPTPNDAGTLTDGGGAADAPSTEDAPAQDAFAGADAGPLPAFDVPTDGAWHYVEIEGAVCANGSPLGVAVNLVPSSDRAVLFLQGGGACWDTATCLLLMTASHLTDTLTEATVLAEAERAGGFILDRDDEQNPYRDQSFVYVPYCTGDVHVGNTSTTYSTPSASTTIEHRGGRNTELILGRLAATYPALARLTMAGESAGGYGVAVNAFRGRAAFPEARLDVLDDSGLLVEVDAEQWDQMMTSWQPGVPGDCPECLDNLTNLLPYYARTMHAGDRFGILASREDETIRTYFSFSPAQLATRVDAMVSSLAGVSSQHVFVNDGDEHVLLSRPALATSGGVSVRAWVTAFATDDPTWGTVGP